MMKQNNTAAQRRNFVTKKVTPPSKSTKRANKQDRALVAALEPWEVQKVRRRFYKETPNPLNELPNIQHPTGKIVKDLAKKCNHSRTKIYKLLELAGWSDTVKEQTL